MSTGYRKGRGRVPGVVAALATVAGAVLLWLGLSGLAQGQEVRLAAPAQEVTVGVGADGFSLWSAGPAAYASAVCTAGGTTLLRPVDGYGVQVGGTTYHELARSPEGLTGEVTVSCEPAQEFHVGPHAQATSSTGLRGTTGVLAGAALLALGLVLAGWSVVARVRRRRLESFRVPARRLDPGLPAREPVRQADAWHPDARHPDDQVPD
ncbi:MAG: hypothetical protein DCC50_11085 [Acidobacteria bacterium]|nr:MAG: hypothetical protein DCC50_11085 [Acidobacteriota bacterium]